jgi:hypothetical protein
MTLKILHGTKEFQGSRVAIAVWTFVRFTRNMDIELYSLPQQSENRLVQTTTILFKSAAAKRRQIGKLLTLCPGSPQL